jgi:hypothetical protein
LVVDGGEEKRKGFHNFMAGDPAKLKSRLLLSKIREVCGRDQQPAVE